LLVDEAIFAATVNQKIERITGLVDKFQAEI
jgi:hypothetical protein